jgi:hypothetical protein
VQRVFDLAAKKVRLIHRTWDPRNGTPVFTVDGRYTTRGWTEWTQGFQYGCAILVFDGAGDRQLLKIGRDQTVQRMLPHVTHTGVHDHGFNNLSTYGNLRRLMREGRMPHNEWELRFHETAIKCSGAVQAARWSGVPVRQPSPHAANTRELGYIYSFNGPHSLFVDTMRTTRILGLAWQLGHVLMHENDKAANLLKRSVLHGLATSQYVVCHGDSSHTYDLRGRIAHEAIFNRNDGSFRCRSTQQGYSPFSTWTRGQAWVLLGFAEELEFLETVPDADLEPVGGRAEVDGYMMEAARAVAAHYVRATPTDGIPYWDTGAPGLGRMPGHSDQPADPGNDLEPVDASAAPIAAQGLLRLGRLLERRGEADEGRLLFQAGLTIARTLLGPPYLSDDDAHQGLLLHSVYHRPNGWDYVPPGRRVPCGESSQWGDYHLRELALHVQRLADGAPYYAFFAPVERK